MLDDMQVLSLPMSVPPAAANRMERSRGTNDGVNGVMATRFRSEPENAGRVAVRYAVRHPFACSVACCGRWSRHQLQPSKLPVRHECGCRMTYTGEIKCSVCESAYDSFHCS